MTIRGGPSLDDRKVAVPQVPATQTVTGRTFVDDSIGETPLLAVRRLGADFPHVKILAKAEWFNPGGSVKDRPALEMLRCGELEGALLPGKTILEATSGNTGIALAMLGAARGYPVVLCLPENASEERKRTLAAYGAEVVETPRLEGTDGAIRRARELARAEPERYYYPDQYNNPANWRAHYLTTAEEIWEQSEGAITHFVCGLGTSGTFTGTTRRLKEISSAITCVSVQPATPLHGIEGLKHMPSSIVPGIYDPTLGDGAEEVTTEEAYYWTKRLAREEGLFVGLSSGAAFAVARRVAARVARGIVVTVFPDGGDKYLSDVAFQESA